MFCLVIGKKIERKNRQKKSDFFFPLPPFGIDKNGSFSLLSRVIMWMVIVFLA